MGWFSKKFSCEDTGTAIAKNCVKILGHIPGGDEAQTGELIVLAIVAHRLGIQLSGLPSARQVCVLAAFDRALSSKIDIRRVGAFLDRRGQQYFEILTEHLEAIRLGNWMGFAEDLSFLFDQFCLGGGEKGAPLVIDNFMDDVSRGVSRGVIASTFFAESFAAARNFVEKQNPT